MIISVGGQHKPHLWLRSSWHDAKLSMVNFPHNTDFRPGESREHLLSAGLFVPLQSHLEEGEPLWGCVDLSVQPTSVWWVGESFFRELVSQHQHCLHMLWGARHFFGTFLYHRASDIRGNILSFLPIVVLLWTTLDSEAFIATTEKSVWGGQAS